MKVIHNLIVTSLASVSAQKLHSQVQGSKATLASVLAKHLPITKILLLSASACARLELASANMH